ncbi:MAG TPA: hypothetical protein VJ732_07825 [Bryobacteraceae bacterium]|nr:hypothetical protein [Bryobacteraceae bacterium]
MATEERFERIEHVTAALAEERRKDREEYKTLWRQTHEQIQELTGQVNRLTIDVDRIILEGAVRDRAAHERDEALGKRIDALVSAMGEFVARLQKGGAQ